MIGPVGQLRAPGAGACHVLLAILLTACVLALPGTASAAGAASASGAGTGAAAGASSGSPAVLGDPLQLTLTRMEPSVVPASGTVTMTGQITNTSDEEWREIRVYPRISYSAITTAQELRTAAASDPLLAFGNRITTPGSFDKSLTELAAGSSATWTVEVPASELRERMSLEDGVYQIGVQALGANSEGRSSSANGRARTFITLMGTGHTRAPASLVVPVRKSVVQDSTGRIAKSDEWEADLAPGGRLSNLASLMASGSDLPVTWLMDPAVVDAVRRLSLGNPRRTLAAPEQPEDPEEPVVGTGPAAEWLRVFTAIGADRSMLALPWGDLDVAAAWRHSPELYERARDLSRDFFEDLSLSTDPAVVPQGGLLPAGALGMLTGDETVLVSSAAVEREARRRLVPPVAEVDGSTVGVHEEAISITAEGDNRTGLTLRQRILAEASVRSLAGNAAGFVVNLPEGFDPGVMAAEFLEGLNRPFVRWQDLSETTAGAPEEESTLLYPAAAERAEISKTTIELSDRLSRAGSMLATVLTSNDTIDAELARLAMISSSYNLRGYERTARTALESAIDWSQRQLGRITIDAPSFVILSADSGTFAIKLQNRLKHSVTVTIVAEATDDLEIQAPSEIILGPESTRTVTLNATARSIGVHPVSLQVADTAGRPFGEPDRMNVRSNSVGKVIWVILGLGVGILFLAIGIRWVRRLRGRSARG